MGKSRKRKHRAVNAVCGIDVGSTSTRICLIAADGAKYMVDSGHEGDATRYERGDFSSTCYPFGTGGEPYIGNQLDLIRLSASLKPVLLLLSGVEISDLKPLICEYPQSELLWQRLHGADEQRRRFRKTLERALECFFKYLRSQTAKLCKDERLRVTSIGVALPGQWPADAEPYITTVILNHFVRAGATKTMAVSRADIFYHCETQALAHYLFNHHFAELRTTGRREETFLLADFGGQNLNVSTYSAQFGGDREKAFFEIYGSEGVVAGGELHDHFIGEHCKNFVKSQNQTPTYSDTQYLTNEFHRVKKLLDSNHGIARADRHLRFYYGASEIQLTPEIVGVAFDRAMEKPLRKISELLDRWVSRKGDLTLKVVVAGGTAKSLALQKELVRRCRKCGLDDPIFKDGIQKAARFPSDHIAEGAAHATRNTMTVAEFLSRGASIGVQMRERGSLAWNNSAPIVYQADKSGINDERPLRLQIHDGEKLKLICNPFQDRRCKDINYLQTYDLHTIGSFKKGVVQIRVSYHDRCNNSNHPALLVAVLWCPELDRDPRPQDWLDGVLTIPLWFDKSSCCILVVEDEVKNQLPPQALMTTDGLETDFVEIGSARKTLNLAPIETSSGGRCDMTAPVAYMQPDSVDNDLSGAILPSPIHI